MLKGGDGLRFALEAGSEFEISGGQDLDRDGAVEPRITGFVHLAEAARAEGGQGCREYWLSSSERRYAPPQAGPTLSLRLSLPEVDLSVMGTFGP